MTEPVFQVERMLRGMPKKTVVNVALFGMSASGKSTLLNALLSSLGQEIIQAARSSSATNEDGQVTLRAREFNMLEDFWQNPHKSTSLDGRDIVLKDCVGFGNEIETQLLLHCKLRDNETFDETKVNEYDERPCTVEEMIHCVLLVIPISFISHSPEQQDQLRNLINLMQSVKINGTTESIEVPIIPILTQCDSDQSKKGRNDLLSGYDGPLRKALSDVEQQLGFARVDVFTMGYLNLESLNVSLETTDTRVLLLSRILERAVRLGYYRLREMQRVRDQHLRAADVNAK